MMISSQCQRQREEGFVNQVKGNDREKEGQLENFGIWDTVWNIARRGDALSLLRLCESDMNQVNRKNFQDETALYIASKYGRTRCVKILLELGAISYVTKEGLTPVRIAVDRGHTEIVQLLCKNNHFGTEVDSIEALIHIAAGKNDYATLSALQIHKNPTLAADLDEEQARENIPLERAKQINAKIAEEVEITHTASIIIKPVIPPLSDDINQWSSADVERWFVDTVPGVNRSTLWMSVFSRYNIDGRILAVLSKREVLSLLQHVGVPPGVRKQFLTNLQSVIQIPDSYDLNEFRQLPLAIGNATIFVMIGLVRTKMSMSVRLLRRMISQASSNLRCVLPDHFGFVAMKGPEIPDEQELSRVVLNLGCIVILAPHEVDTPTS